MHSWVVYYDCVAGKLWFPNRTKMTYLAPSLNWVWVYSYWILNVKRAPNMSSSFYFEMLLRQSNNTRMISNPFQKKKPWPKHPSFCDKIFKIDHSTSLPVKVRLIFFYKTCKIISFDFIDSLIWWKCKSAKRIKNAISTYCELFE